MKNIFSTILFIIPILTFSQDFIIAQPNIDELKAEMKRTNYADDVIYLFLNLNYDSISKKREITYYDYLDYSICSFNQDFENGINYSIEQCKEAGGATISLVLPKTKRESLVKWIEGIFKSSPMDIQHGWNLDKSKFGPTDNGAGCYFEINETNENTLVKNYCGC
ncbi:hypothetical protein [Mangrovimonas sp. TPBH4]|uniref:hypothetical protein n=1 Tax=Mangrovimonas sp. TPBH4 TaxID=1645914 RepID=UPI0006B56482|nr:hypothetical protein [Mangrovimonas sp. TPBH4]